MNIDKICNNYREFLEEFGASSEGFCIRQDLHTIEVSERIARILVSGNIGLLTDDEVISMYQIAGVEHFHRKLPLNVKVKQFEHLLKVVGLNVSSAIDFGCGTGLLPVFLAKNMGWNMAGVDGWVDALSFCGDLSIERGAKVDLYNSHVSNTGIEEGSYELAYAIDLIDCSREWQKIVREMVRVANKRVAIVYCLESGFRKIDPLDVIAEFTKSSATVDIFECFDINGGTVKCVISATKNQSASDSSSGLVVVRSAQLH